MPRASGLEAEIKRTHPDAEIELVRGSKGIFDVLVDENLIFSKHQAGRFPEDSEILGALT